MCLIQQCRAQAVRSLSSGRPQTAVQAAAVTAVSCRQLSTAVPGVVVMGRPVFFCITAAPSAAGQAQCGFWVREHVGLYQQHCAVAAPVAFVV